MESLLMTPAEAARALRIGRSTLYRMFDRGEIKSVKIGGARRVERSELAAYIERLSQQG